MADTIKICSICGEGKDLSGFSEAGNGKKRADCKVCHAKTTREYYKGLDRETFRERHRKNTKKWRDANPEKTRRNIDRYRHLRRAAGSYTLKDIDLQLKNQSGKCWWCGKVFMNANRQLRQTIDHRIPISRGGTNNPDNLVIAHSKCNSRKSNKMPWEWIGRLL